MSRSISSAEPKELFRYADAATHIDRELTTESYRLAQALERFQATCREGAFRVPVNGLDSALRRYACQSQQIDDWVHMVGLEFQKADEAQRAAASIWVDLWNYATEQLAGVDKETLIKHALALRLLFNLRAGTYYPGEVILRDPIGAIIKFLPDELKDIVGTPRSIRETMGLSGYLNHIKWLNLPRHMAKKALLASVAIEAIQFPFTAMADIREYADKGFAHQAAAITVDAAGAGLRIGGGALGTYLLGTAAVAVMATIGAPVTIAAGAVIVAGVVDGIVGGLVANWINEKVREPAIEGLAEAIDQVGEVASDLADRAVQTGERVAQRAASFMQDAVEAAQRVKETAVEAGREAARAATSWVQQQARRFEKGLAPIFGNIFGRDDPNPDFSLIEAAQGAQYTHLDGELFVKGSDDVDIHPSDVDQGGIGDCYFMAAIAAIAQVNPEAIRHLIRPNRDGTYTVTFYERKNPIEAWGALLVPTIVGMGPVAFVTIPTAMELIFGPQFKPVEVTVTPDFPNRDGKWVFAKRGGLTEEGQPELWTMLVEKAYARYKGSYNNIDGGFAHKAMEELTGVESKFFSPKSIDIEKLAEYQEKGYAVTASSAHDWELKIPGGKVWDIPDLSDTDPIYLNGILVSDHEYYITAIDKVNKTVTLRNPWSWYDAPVVLDFETFQRVFSRIALNPTKSDK